LRLLFHLLTLAGTGFSSPAPFGDLLPQMAWTISLRSQQFVDKSFLRNQGTDTFINHHFSQMPGLRKARSSSTDANHRLGTSCFSERLLSWIRRLQFSCAPIPDGAPSGSLGTAIIGFHSVHGADCVTLEGLKKKIRSHPPRANSRIDPHV
jgi:hypothetical protein